MHLLEDTRKHEIKHEYWKRIGAQIMQVKLPFGDYAAVSSVVVDTKRDIYEIAGNILNDHTRFRSECISAQECGCKLVILVENLDGVDSLKALESWKESDRHFRMRNGVARINGRRG